MRVGRGSLAQVGTIGALAGVFVMTVALWPSAALADHRPAGHSAIEVAAAMVACLSAARLGVHEARGTVEAAAIYEDGVVLATLTRGQPDRAADFAWYPSEPGPGEEAVILRPYADSPRSPERQREDARYLLNCMGLIDRQP
jgi:hypothetical protein